jgi:protein-S-isoprenylcysteine O-methyltransferase Ste14
VAFGFDLAVTLVGLIVFGQHVWALRGHFASERMTTGARIISLGALAACFALLLLLWSQAQPLGAQIVGIAVMVASLALFWAAVRASREAKLRFAFDEALPRSLVTIGPYAQIRHPFYTSYLLFWIGWGIAVWSIWALIPILVMAALYTVAARYEENLLGDSDMATAYAEYRQRAGMFWPKLRNIPFQ